VIAERRERAAPAWLLVVLVVAMAGLFLAVMPIRTYLSQNRSEATLSRELRALNRQDGQLAQRIRQMNQPAQIESIARSRYGLVEPGEKAYTILPAPSSGQAVGSVPRGAAVPAPQPTSTAPPPGSQAGAGGR
jgi:cell division protein FtsB